jgi:hypothetical protein
MTLMKKALLGSAAAFAAVSGAAAADLPSRKAAPAAYVKICDAYGAGFFYIPGTDTCVKVGGYVRADYIYAPGQKVYAYTGSANPALNTTSVAAFSTPIQSSSAMSTSGMEMRGRVDVDARTATPWGTARTFIRVRLNNTSGIRNDGTVNNGVVAQTGGATNSTTLQSALVQWAGFTFGVAPANYALLPDWQYTAPAYAIFPSGVKQLAYTATFGGGLSATLAVEDRTDWGYSANTSQFTYVSRADTGFNLVGNIRWDQSWGFAALQGAVGNNSMRADYGVAPEFGTVLGGSPGYSATQGSATTGAYAIGTSLMFNLPMLSPGDKLWLTANYTRGMLGALMQGGGLSAGVGNNEKYLLGGITRVDQNLVVTGGAGTAANPYTVGSTTGWNVAAAMLHYWLPNLRSQATVGYIEVNPPSSTLTEWGKGRAINLSHALIFSPAKDFDLGLEVQYLNVRNTIQNPAANFVLAGSPGLKESNWSMRLRAERSF